jgi:hypothetical protein
LQGELAASHANVGDALQKTGQSQEAKEHFTAAREMLAKLVTQYPDRAQWKTELTWLDQQLAAPGDKADADSTSRTTRPGSSNP